MKLTKEIIEHKNSIWPASTKNSNSWWTNNRYAKKGLIKKRWKQQTNASSNGQEKWKSAQKSQKKWKAIPNINLCRSWRKEARSCAPKCKTTSNRLKKSSKSTHLTKKSCKRSIIKKVKPWHYWTNAATSRKKVLKNLPNFHPKQYSTGTNLVRLLAPLTQKLSHKKEGNALVTQSTNQSPHLPTIQQHRNHWKSPQVNLCMKE